ncbi:MAG TPA: hypothetical protein VGO71_00820 [Baekduia sp.]|nr:hypothetical protein [Baekduia sp.]
MSDSDEGLVAAFAAGDVEPLVAAARERPERANSYALTAAQSVHEAALVAGRAGGHLPAERWAAQQLALESVAGLGTVDARPVAELVIRGMLAQDFWPGDEVIDRRTLAWCATAAPDATADALRERDGWAGTYGLLDTADGVGGAVGGWLLARIVEEDPDHMAETDGLATDDDWIHRLRALAELPVTKPPAAYGALSGRAPRRAMPWAIRVAFAYAEPPDTWTLNRLGIILRQRSADDPELDGMLMPWDSAARWPEQFRLLLAAWTSTSDEHAALVGAATGSGLISPELAVAIGTAEPRPAWTDGPAPWEYAGVVAAGTVRIPDGRLAACDPIWGREASPPAILVAPGIHNVELFTAVHPFYEEPGSAAIVVRLVDTAVTVWEVFGEYQVGHGGLACFGALAALETQEEILSEDLFGPHAASDTCDLGAAGSVVMVNAVEQDAICHTWIGRDADGHIVRVLTDLGLLELDPLVDPDLPWE